MEILALGTEMTWEWVVVITAICFTVAFINR